MTDWSDVSRGVRVGAVGVAVGCALAGLSTHTLLSEFGVPVPYVVAAAPLLGVVLYRWTGALVEVLFGLAVTALVAFPVTVAGLAGPPLARTESVAVSNAIVVDAVVRTLAIGGLGFLLLVLGVVAMAVVDNELLQQLPGERRAVTLWVVVLVVAAALGGVAVRNFDSAVDQRSVTAEVSGVTVEDGDLVVTVRVPNRLTGTLTVESVVVSVETPGGEQVTGRALPDRRVTTGDSAPVTVTVPADPVFDGNRTRQVTVGGYVYVHAFSNYEARLDIEPRTLVVEREG